MASVGRVSQEWPEIPDKLFFRIGDVSDIAGVETYVLRFWESEFPSLRPRKTPSGQRQYRRKDVQMVLTIKDLLYGEGYTIAGARKVLKSGKSARPAAPGRREDGAPKGSPADSKQALREIRLKLEQILDLLSP